jgi:hypothetical protein
MIKNLVKRIFELIYSTLYSTKINSSNFESKFAEELREEISKIPKIKTDNQTGAELEWSNNVNSILDYIMTRDPRKFLSWDVIKKTMFVVRESYINLELQAIKNSNEFDTFWKKVITENSVGAPMKFWKYSKSSANLIHHAYHLFKLKEKTNIEFNKLDLVVEFGGGYGSMCRLIHNCNFSGKYIIFDLPVFSALQKFYLKCVGLEILKPEEFKSNKSGIICISDLQQFEDLISGKIKENESLFIGTWSLSETPLLFREKFKTSLKFYKNYLIGFQERFNEVNNVEYFENIQKEFSDYKWVKWEIQHLKHHYYLIGTKNN